jgi:hypothetical protein
MHLSYPRSERKLWKHRRKASSSNDCQWSNELTGWQIAAMSATCFSAKEQCLRLPKNRLWDFCWDCLVAICFSTGERQPILASLQIAFASNFKL